MKPETDLEKYIMSVFGHGYKVRTRVSPRLKRYKTMPLDYDYFLGEEFFTFQLKTDDIIWKKVVKLCEGKGYGHPTNLKEDEVHIPDWETYGLPFDQYGKNTLQECVRSSDSDSKDDESREPSNDLVRGS